MKKFILVCLIFQCLTVYANEVTEDYFDIASNYAIYGKYNEAINYIDKILQLEPSNSEAKELKNTLLRVINPNGKSYLTSVNKNIQQARDFKINGNKSKELSTLSATANDFWSMYIIAQYYSDNGDYKNSISYYQKAIALKPDYSQSYLGIARAYLESGDYNNTINSIDKYLTYNKESDIAYALRADANMNLNYLSQAQNDINRALEIEENITYLLIEAKILYYKGDYYEAKEKLNLLSRNVQTSEVFKYMGLCDYAMNNLSGALLNIDKAIILSDEDKTLNSTYNKIKSMLDTQ